MGSTVELEPNDVLTIDLNRDGIVDTLIATDYGVSVQLAEEPLVLKESQVLNSGVTKNMLLFDFDGDGDKDLSTVDENGTVRFFENYRAGGFSEVGEPAHVNSYGKMYIQDRNNDGQMDILVEIAQDIWDFVNVGDTFGQQPMRSSGKRGVRYALFDHLGSTKMMINDSGEVVWPVTNEAEVNELLPFGQEVKILENTSETTYNLNFTNKELDRDLALNYFGARYYQPDFPRFLSVDPVSGTPEIPLSWNRYLYCRNDPLNKFDPNGKWGANVHFGSEEYGGTLQFAQDAGMNYEDALIVATACNAVDEGNTGPMPWQDDSRHFNTIIGAESGGPNDSRMIHANNHLQQAIKFENAAQEVEAIAGPGAGANLHKAALQELGTGLHSLQDVDAHTDEAVSQNNVLGVLVYHHLSHMECDDPGDPEKPSQAFTNTVQRTIDMINHFQEATNPE